MAKRLDPKVAKKIMVQKGLLPLVEYPGSGKRWKSRCLGCERIVFPNFDSIQQGRGGCIECGKQKSAQKRRKLDAKDLKVKLKKYRIEAKTELILMDDRYEFVCKKCNENFVFSLRHLITTFPNPCPFCAGRRVSKKRAVFVMEKANLKPLVNYPGNHVPWKSECMKCKKIVSPRFSAIQRGRGGCVFCAKIRVDPSNAEKTMLNMKLQPLVPFPGGEKPWLCKCLRCNNEITPKYTNARVNKMGCLWCAKQKVDEKQAEKAMMAANLKPLTPYPGSSTKWKSRCLVCKKVVYPRWEIVRKSGRGCSGCKGGNISKAKRFKEDKVIPLMTIKKLKPLEPYPGTGRPWKCKCLQCGKEVFPKHENLVQGQGGCKYCAESGLDYLAPACVYLIFHENWGANKIGVAGLHTKRLAKHKSKGWKIYQLLTVSNGEVAFKIEQRVLKWIRQTKEFPPYLSKVDGWSETFDADGIPLDEVWDKVQKIALEIEGKSS